MVLRSGFKMANNEQTNLAVISNTNQTPNEPYIVPFDSENGMLIEYWLDYFNNACKLSNKDDSWKTVNISKYLKGSALTQYTNSCLNISNFGELCSILIENFLKPNVITLSDFSQLQLKDNLEQYFHQKLNYGRQLVLPSQLIMEGLTDGMPTSIKQQMIVNPPTSPTDWFMVATRLMKIQAPKPEQNTFRQNAPIRPRQNTFVPQTHYFVRPKFQNVNRMRPQHLPNQQTHNFNNRGFRPNHHTHFQHGLSPYPCKICTQQGIPNAYHWKLQCPFNQHKFRQTPFNCDPPLAANAVPQSSENTVDSQQIPNQRQHPLLRPLAQHIDNYKCPDTSHHCQV
ncbi:uncharacterized protein TNCV_53811 [Trichonephila clavipes]|nr:uncharacterized protein TNCV_53811 [Trichonephila clavipes]